MDNLKKIAIKRLKERGVKIYDIAYLVKEEEIKRDSNISIKKCMKIVESIIAKREVYHTILTGIALDKAADYNMLDSEINKIIKKDESLYGLDEVLVLSILNIYGSIAFSNFGYLDKIKPGIIGKLDQEKYKCNTYLDDIVAALVAASLSKIAHQKKPINY